MIALESQFSRKKKKINKIKSMKLIKVVAVPALHKHWHLPARRRWRRFSGATYHRAAAAAATSNQHKRSNWHFGTVNSASSPPPWPTQPAARLFASPGGKWRRRNRTPDPSSSRSPRKPCCSLYPLFDPLEVPESSQLCVNFNSYDYE